MIIPRPAHERGHANYGWLDTYYTFSFADYFDPNHMGFRALRVINDDTVEGGGGFPTHPHQNMEIVTFVAEGALEHRDSMGNGSVISAGEVQVMSAGTGIRHSEYNPSPSKRVQLLQIWLLPAIKGATPRYDQRSFRELLDKPGVHPLVSGDGRSGLLYIHQDAQISLVNVAPKAPVAIPIAQGRHMWIQMMRGQATVKGVVLNAGDGAALSDESALAISGEGRMLAFDLA